MILNNFSGYKKAAFAFLLIGMVLCSNNSFSEVHSRAATNSKSITIKDVMGNYLIKNGVATGIKFNSSKLKLYKDLTTTDSYTINLKKLTCTLDKYCSQKNIKSVELLFLDSDIDYSKKFWDEPSISINPSSVTGFTHSITHDWKGVIYTRIVDMNNKVTINKSNGIIVDTTVPEILGVSNDSIYNNTVFLTVKDNLSGVKSISMKHIDTEGKENITEFKKNDFKKGITLNNSGIYEIKVTDLSGNQNSCKFTISK